MHQSTTFPQSRNTHCSYTTAHISLNQKSCILAHVERDMTKLFMGESLIALVFSLATALSGRDEEEVAQRARTNIIFILLGLVVIALSAVIVNFIIGAT